MSQSATESGRAPAPQATPTPPHRAASSKSFTSNAALIGGITFISRILGMARESIAANYFGAGAIYSAFTFAFTIPNLFRKLLGEGALSAAFIPLYAQAVKRENELNVAIEGHDSAGDFAAASVNLLVLILLALTLIGEAILVGMWVFLATRSDPRLDYIVAVKLTVIMLPYVLMVCGAAFLGGILQVHHRFAATAATAIVSNICLIVAMIAAAAIFNLHTEAGRERGVEWLAASVLVAGVLQIVILLPSLRRSGFRFRIITKLWSPAIRKMLLLSLPVAFSAGVLQLGVVLDKGIAFLLARSPDHGQFTVLGHVISLPMVEGAAARLNWAQFMYQFPLGVFAIALATAIFPKLSSDAQHDIVEGEEIAPTESSLGGARPMRRLTKFLYGHRGATPAVRGVPEQFKTVLRHGIEASLFIGLPASIGMIIVRYPAVKLLFQRGNFGMSDTYWVARSTAFYSAAIWAFSLQQILNRAYYALHDATTPLVWTIVNLLINLVIEIPLLWTSLGESAMAVGTLVSFAIQSTVMLWLLDRRVGGLGLSASAKPIAKMVMASLLMWAACAAVQHTPGWPHRETRLAWAIQLGGLMLVGAGSYFFACIALGLDVMKSVPLRRSRRAAS